MPGSRWVGHACLGSSWLLYAGPVGPTDLHAHHALQLCLALGPPPRIVDGTGTEVAGHGILLGPNRPHRIVQGAPTVGLLFLDPDDRLGRSLCARFGGRDGPTWIPCPETARSIPDPLPTTAPDLAAWARTLTDTLGRTPRHPAPRHPAVVRALRLLEPADRNVPSLAELSARVGLSSSRLRHLFVAELGLGYRAYVRWRRLRAAVSALEGGANLAHAAAAAGFADGAHLSRTFRSLFGLPPTAFTAAVTWHRAPER